MKYIWFLLFSHIVEMKDNAAVIEYIKLPCQRGSINVEFVLIFPSANHSVRAAKRWGIKSVMAKILLGINMDTHNFFNTAGYFYFLEVLKPLVSHVTLRCDLGHHLGWPHIPMCSQEHKKLNGEQRQAVSTQGFGPALSREAVVVTLPKVICRFSSKGLDALST